MSNNETKKSRPSHTIFQVIGEKEKSRWIRVGAGWTNKDGKGLTLVFDSYPVVGRTMLREITKQDEASNEVEQPK